MIKKVFFVFIILILFLVLGVFLLIIFVDPNNLKEFISTQVKNKTGYNLVIEGDLRWSIWPHINITTNSIDFNDGKSQKSILMADNMRLDVELIPLFSKKIIVKNIFIQNAYINIIDEIRQNLLEKQKNIIENSSQTELVQNNQVNDASNWIFELNRLEIVKSGIFYQSGKDVYHLKDINLSIAQKDNQNFSLDFSGNAIFNKQSLIYSLNSNINIDGFPKEAKIDINKLSYNYKGSETSSGQFKGEFASALKYYSTPLTISSENLVLSLNNNNILGKILFVLNDKPFIDLSLKTENLDFKSLLLSDSQSDKNQQVSNKKSTTISKGNDLSFLQKFDAKLNLSIKRFLFNGIDARNIFVDLNNKDGIAVLQKANLDVANGSVFLSGNADGKKSFTDIKIKTNIKDLNLGLFLEQLKIVENVKGSLNADASFLINSISFDDIFNNLGGDFQLHIQNVKFKNLNVQKSIEDVLSRVSKQTLSSNSYTKYIELRSFNINGKLSKGNANFTSINADSDSLNLIGNGFLGLIDKKLDVNLKVKMLSGWSGNKKTIERLQKMEIPVHLYGTFSEPHYRVEIEKVLQDALNDRIQSEINNQVDRLKDKLKVDEKKIKDTLKIDEQKIKSNIGNLLNKLK